MVYNKVMIESIGSRIETAMQDAGLTKAQVATKLNTSPQAVYGWVKTDRIRKDNLSRLALILGVSTDWLVFGEGYTPGRTQELAQEWSSNAARSEALNIGRKVQTAPTEVKELLLQLIDLAENDENKSIEVSKALTLLTNGFTK